MNNPMDYSNDDWAAWYDRATVHTKITPRLTRDLRTSHRSISHGLLATAEASLVDIDNDILAGEFLTQYVKSGCGSHALVTIVDKMSRIANDLLQAIVEARSVETDS